jgi:undecaprenyl-diphosphatase
VSYLHTIVLGIVQGLSEFLPISSSGHLVLVPWLLGWPASSVFFDVLLHCGTLVAVLVYFRTEVRALIQAFVESIVRRKIDTPEARLAWLIVAGTIPSAVFAFLFQDFFESLFSTPVAVAALLLVTAVGLFVADRLARGKRTIHSTRLPDALIIGAAQAAAVAPGISRSGATIVAGVFRGLSREAAARFSFLLSIPIILGAGLSQMTKALDAPAATPWAAAAVGFAFAAVSGYLAIAFMLRHLQRGRLWPFAAYCAAAGVFSLLVFFLRAG